MWKYFSDENYPEDEKAITIIYSDDTQDDIIWHTLMKDYINWNNEDSPLCWKYIDG